MLTRKIRAYVVLPLSNGGLKLFELGCPTNVAFLREFEVFGGIIRRMESNLNLYRSYALPRLQGLIACAKSVDDKSQRSTYAS